MSTAAIVAGTAAAGLGGAALSSNAASSAAAEQAQAAEQAAQLQYQASQNALGFQEQQYNTGQAEMQPWLQSGTGALSNLDYLMGVTPQTAGGSALNSGASPLSSASALPTTAGFTGNTNPVGTGAAPGPAQGPSLASSGVPTSVARPGGTGQPVNPLGGVSPTAMTASGLGGATSPITGASPTSFNPATGTASTGPVGVPGSSLPSTPTQAAQFNASAPGNSAAGGFGSLLQPYSGSFSAPTAAEALQSPGEQAQLQLGEQAMQQSAAAQGNLLTGGTAQALDAYGQNLASTYYQNAYNNAYNTYATNYNQYENQQNNEFNRLSALAGGGQTAASQLGSLGANAANSVTNNVLGTASNIGQEYNNAAAANASGIVGSANALNSGISGITGNLTQLALLQQLYGGGGSGGISSADVPDMPGVYS